MEDLKQRTAIVTGGGSGIGLAITRALVDAGMNVVIGSRRLKLLTDVANKLNTAGKGKAVPVACDVRKKADVVELVRRTRELFPAIDVLVNNTGLGGKSKIVDCTDEEWDLVLDTNLKGTFWTMREVLPAMIARRSGYIINIASQAAKHGYPNAGPYCASKFGIVGLSEALQAEVREHGIHVHCLCPALVQVPPPATEADVDHGVLQVDDLARSVMFLLSQPGRVKFENIGLYHL